MLNHINFTAASPDQQGTHNCDEEVSQNTQHDHKSILVCILIKYIPNYLKQDNSHRVIDHPFPKNNRK